ncbi:Zn(II)2Cys6 transcription factor [Aspergillus mulundensis]|uniref:Zn(2)-C6 fungal-type domain-containing protein n=1 Tax=Aspergillus mulundensis TaxID=1810919 RepID=A0A3D8RFC7_9EURO|nr:hypothetical protein DSM5745_07838 [Aspergillus mulundensis]RDW72666.1 hypothetical protein DSM5745_07838 [Aspergillus mulundensis]
MPPSINACLSCRKVKMKCVTSTESERCDRCLRKALTCVFREHCRGRRPGMRLARKQRRPEHGASTVQEVQPSPTDFWAESDGFQPHGLLSHQAMQGKFSLQNILSVDHGPGTSPDTQAAGLDGEQPSDEQSQPQPQPPAVSQEDPIALGLINMHVATHLHEYFMGKINPYISQLDPLLHTFRYLQKVPFLLTAALAVAAKAFESALYPPLHEHAENLFVECVRRGDKSAEIVQAILLLTYWKEPNDTRAWMSVGLAIRMAFDMGWHKLAPSASRKSGLSELQKRAARNIERTFLVLFVYDRSLSLQTGKPWMIERNELIDAAESWWRDDEGLANSNDQLLSAFTALRLITADTFDLLSPAKTAPHRVDRLLGVIDQRIQAWQKRWLEIISSNSSALSSHGGLNRKHACHKFLVTFYGSHLRLQLFSVPLQETRIRNADGTFDLKPFWLSYQSALDMMQLVTESSGLLYLAQDSVHVMTAYAAIFLIKLPSLKLLLSSPHPIRQEIEPVTTKAIRDAAGTFAGLSAPPTSSCAFQARFLEKILFEYGRTQHSPRPLVESHSAPQLGEQSLQETMNRRNSIPIPHHNDLDRTRPGLVNRSEAVHQFGISAQPGRVSGQSSMLSAGPGLYQTYGHTLTHATNTRSQLECDQSSMHPNLSPPAPFDPESEGLGFLFDEEKWDDMFASAGFSIQEGVFFR